MKYYEQLNTKETKNKMHVKTLNLSKQSAMECAWLQSIGWKIIDPWNIEGSEPVEIDLTTGNNVLSKIIDLRYLEFAETFDLFSYYGVSR